MDLFKCLGAPLVASHPHFYMADEYYLTLVDGLAPSKVRNYFFILYSENSEYPFLKLDILSECHNV